MLGQQPSGVWRCCKVSVAKTDASVPAIACLNQLFARIVLILKFYLLALASPFSAAEKTVQCDSRISPLVRQSAIRRGHQWRKHRLEPPIGMRSWLNLSIPKFPCWEEWEPGSPSPLHVSAGLARPEKSGRAGWTHSVACRPFLSLGFTAPKAGASAGARPSKPFRVLLLIKIQTERSFQTNFQTNDSFETNVCETLLKLYVFTPNVRFKRTCRLKVPSKRTFRLKVRLKRTFRLKVRLKRTFRLKRMFRLKRTFRKV